MFTNALVSILTALPVGTPKPLPPANCALYNSLATAISAPLALVLGLLSFVPWIVVIGLLVALFVAHKQHASNNVIRWLIRVIVIALVVGLVTSGTIVGTVINSSC